MTNDLLFNRFRPNSVAGRMLKFLSNGKPRTISEIARSSKPKSVDNILAPGGWYSQLRRFGKSSRKFKLDKTDTGRIVMTVRRAKVA